MHARVVLGVEKGVLFREVSSVQRLSKSGIYSLGEKRCPVCVLLRA